MDEIDEEADDGNHSDQPEWFKNGRKTKATYADGYSGWVIDLGDGTCRFANDPLLGEDGPKWGDRVDLFYDPCDLFKRPRVGYRIYREGEEPVGHHFAVHRPPTAKEIDEHEEREEQEEAARAQAMEGHFEAMMAPSKILKAETKTSDEIIRYFELRAFAEKQGLKIPDDLHSEETRRKESEESKTPEARKKSKLFLLATACASYDDVEVTEAEVYAEADCMRKEEAAVATLREQFPDIDEGVTDAKEPSGFEREEITDDWRQWKAGRLAWALEHHLLPPEDVDNHRPPDWLRAMLDENEAEEQPIPMGLGHHGKTGYFVLCSQGQGPGICGIELLGPPEPCAPADEEDDDDEESIPF